MEPFDAAIIGIARDRLCHHRDDADAGRRLRADGLHAGAHRPAVHRVRAGAGRRGAGLGLRRADADADDVLAPARSRCRASGASTAAGAAASTRWRAAIAACCGGVSPAPGCWCRSWLAGARVAAVCAVPADARRARRRSRIAATCGPTVRAPEGVTIDCTARNARQLEAICARCPEVESTSSSSGVPDGDARHRVAPAQALGGAEAQVQQEIAGSLRPELAGAGRGRGRRSARRPWARIRADRPVQLVIQTSGSYEELARGHRPVRARGRRRARHHRRQRRAELETPSWKSTFDRQKAADWASTWTGRAHAGDACWAAARSPATSATPSSTT